MADKIRDEISPDEIRHIRKTLGLSQVEAGELLGGGARAFTKYENGTIKPATAIVTLLRLLEVNPGMITLLKGDPPRPVSDQDERGPFEVAAGDVTKLTPVKLHKLLERLLMAEALAHDISVGGIHVAGNTTASDGGEDGRIQWDDGPVRTNFIPHRFTQFQLKTGYFAPGRAEKEVLTKQGGVKPMVRKALENGGHYLLLCASVHTKKAIVDRENRIRDTLRAKGITFEDSQIELRDAGQIAAWVNSHPSVAIWILEETQSGTVGPFHSWSHWLGRGEHEHSPWAEDERLGPLRNFLFERIREPQGIARVVGLSAIGKSRLVLEAIRAIDGEKEEISRLVLYTDASEVNSESIHRTVHTWAETGRRAIVIVDRCMFKTHRTLSNATQRSGSRLSLVTIDNELTTNDRDVSTSFCIDQAPLSVTEEIIASRARGMDDQSRRRLARFTDGYPGLAIGVSDAWDGERPILNAPEDHFVDAFINGRRFPEKELETTARLLSVFGLLLYHIPSADRLNGIVGIDQNLTVPAFRQRVGELIRRGVVQRRGRYVRLHPRPVALRLCERQWSDWSQEEWDKVLSRLEPQDLRTLAARQLAWLGETDVSRQVVNHVCRRGGPFDVIEGNEGEVHAEVLWNLAEIEPEAVVNQLKRSLDSVNDLLAIEGSTRRYLVEALAKICFHRETFEEGADLLLRLAAAETEPDLTNNATGQFCALFPMLLGSTEAGGKSRLTYIREAARTDDPGKLAVVVEGLIKATKTDSFIRFGSAQRRGLLPDLIAWQPSTQQEAKEYVCECLNLLKDIGNREDEIGQIARAGMGGNFRPLVANGYIDSVEGVVTRVGKKWAPWKSARISLGSSIQFDSGRLGPDTTERVKKLIKILKPKDLAHRARYLITDMPWDFPEDQKLDMEKRASLQEKAINELAGEFVHEPDELRKLLPDLCHGYQRMATLFGTCLVERIPNPLEWLEEIKSVTRDIPDDKRNYDLLVGCLSGISDRYPDIVEANKQDIAESPKLAPALPDLCLLTGISPGDVELANEAVLAGRLPPDRLLFWRVGGQFAKLPREVVTRLFEVMLDHSAEGFSVCLELMGTYRYGENNDLDNFRPQICTAAEKVLLWDQEFDGAMDAFYFGEIMKWILEKGRDDPDARSVALTLSKALAQNSEISSERLLRPLVTTLLSEFPEISWPLIGNAIVADESQAWKLYFLLSEDQMNMDGEKRAILSLPEETLFAWCSANPDVAPEFAASVLPILMRKDNQAGEWHLHPLMSRLLDEFGDVSEVVKAIESNMNSYSWVGSVAPYYQRFVKPLEELKTHSKMNVRRWASKALRRIHQQIENAHMEDDEREAHIQS
ncbi:MAG: hypothetical protein F4206_00015 [Gammaproteobacteria bacterium]|nr:hypothetical protein [Gammaproteobacteria bacterium]MYG65102.1 hypothetical protein [Gammaproteobacteria bacterium]